MDREDSCGADSYPVPKDKPGKFPDFSTRDGNKPKFHRYVVYNHTSCKCGTFAE